MIVFVAVPAYDAKVGVETVRALLNEQLLARELGWELRVSFLPGCSLITHARNQLAADFLASDAERMVFVDADVSWEAGSLLKLASYPQAFVGGAYRFKTEPENYPVSWLDHSEPMSPDGLGQVAGLPGGFLSLSRSVFERLKAAHPDRTYEHGGHAFHGYFHAPIRDGRMHGEDSAFCADWRDLGEACWLDPNLTLTHSGGVNTYAGRIADWLNTRN